MPPRTKPDTERIRKEVPDKRMECYVRIKPGTKPAGLFIMYKVERDQLKMGGIVQFRERDHMSRWQRILIDEIRSIGGEPLYYGAMW